MVKRPSNAFTLLELMLAMTVLVLLMVLIMQVVGFTQKVTTLVSGQLQSFQEARIGFERLARKLPQATLNTYWDYDNPTNPTKYQRNSELQFLCGPTGNSLFSGLLDPQKNPSHALFFEAPIGFFKSSNYSGMETLLNACGYYIQFGSDAAQKPFSQYPSLIRERWRFRLMEWLPPSESLAIYKKTNANPSYNASDWIDLTATETVHPLADNVVALIVLPKLSPSEDSTGTQLSSDYCYDSRTSVTSDVRKNQLPPLVQIVMVAIDEPSATRLAALYGSTMPPLVPATLFQTSSKFQEDLDTLESILKAAPGNAAGNSIPP
jgi:uncharacterized protein (TIGR02599 family)